MLFYVCLTTPVSGWYCPRTVRTTSRLTWVTRSCRCSVSTRRHPTPAHSLSLFSLSLSQIWPYAPLTKSRGTPLGPPWVSSEHHRRDDQSGALYTPPPSPLLLSPCPPLLPCDSDKDIMGVKRFLIQPPLSTAPSIYPLVFILCC